MTNKYDKTAVGNACRSCEKPTLWHINGEYALCPSCMDELASDVQDVFEYNNPKKDQLAYLKDLQSRIGDKEWNSKVRRE